VTLPAGARGSRPSVVLSSSVGYASRAMSPTWIWLQGAIVVFVLIGMIIAITKLA
jgi:hypothetical protein